MFRDRSLARLFSAALFGLLAGVALAQDQIAPADPGLVLTDPITKQPGVRLVEYGTELVPPKLSPKSFGSRPQHWAFDWRIASYGYEGSQQNLRFVVFSQERDPSNDRAAMVARMLSRLWEYNYGTLGMDHSIEFGGGRVDVYLCFGGKAGGEQLFDEDDQYGRPEKVDTIYLYDLKSFTGPVEMAREVAHEYGHATLNPIGGYTEPEYWANGYLGERLFVRHVTELMEKGLLGPEDAMGATAAQLRAWVTSNVDPLVAQAAANGPNPAPLKDKSKAGMDAYLGLALYVDTLFPERVFGRSMAMVGSNDAKDYPDSIVFAAEEPDSYTLRIPAYLAGRPLWIPLGGKATLTGATVVRRSGDWALIQPGKGHVTITNHHD